MDKKRALPVLATAMVALSLSACGTMGKREGGTQTSSAQTSQSGAGAAQSAQTGSAAASQQAAAPDLVRDVQRTLGAKGYDAGQPDGVYGTSTEQALRRFQRDQRLNATGQIDTQTLAALGLASDAQAGQRAATANQGAPREYTPSTRRQGAMSEQPSGRAQSASAAGLSADQIRRTQQNLADRGYDVGRPDGVWGPRTAGALRNFERDQNLQADGRPDPQSLAALGVETGSPTTQTGAMPEGGRGALPPERSAVPPSSANPGTVDPSQSDVADPGAQQGLLPPTGSQAPGAAREQERAPVSPGGAPDTTVYPEETTNPASPR